MRLKFISILATWLMFALAGILPCSAVNVIPYPQSVEMTDVVFNKKKIDKVKYVTDKEMPSEAYELCIKKSGVVIKASDDKGRFYALQTLKQLAEAEVM
jgi:hexosaminidase